MSTFRHITCCRQRQLCGFLCIGLLPFFTDFVPYALYLSGGMFMNQTYMKEKPILPLLLSMALPMVISMMVNSLYNIVDSYFVARISEEAMTALSLVYPIQNFITSRCRLWNRDQCCHCLFPWRPGSEKSGYSCHTGTFSLCHPRYCSYRSHNCRNAAVFTDFYKRRDRYSDGKCLLPDRIWIFHCNLS